MANERELTDKEKATVEPVRSRFMLAKEARRPIEERWVRYYELFRARDPGG